MVIGLEILTELRRREIPERNDCEQRRRERATGDSDDGMDITPVPHLSLRQ